MKMPDWLNVQDVTYSAAGIQMTVQPDLTHPDAKIDLEASLRSSGQAHLIPALHEAIQAAQNARATAPLTTQEVAALIPKEIGS